MPGLSMSTKNITKHSLLFKSCKIRLQFQIRKQQSYEHAFNEHWITAALARPSEFHRDTRTSQLHPPWPPLQWQTALVTSESSYSSSSERWIYFWVFFPQHLNSAALNSNQKWQSHSKQHSAATCLINEASQLKHCRKKLPGKGSF